MKRAALMLFMALIIFSKPAFSNDRTVNNLIEAFENNGTDNLAAIKQDELSFYVGYFTGSFETAMDLGIKLGVLCFSNPMPNYNQFFEEFVRDYLIHTGELGVESSNKLQIDTMIQISLKKRYSCEASPK